MIHPELLEILCCPENRQRVVPAPGELLAELNRGIRAGTVKKANGAAISELEEGLVREDGQFLYPVRDDIPIMLIEERVAIPNPEADAPGGIPEGDSPEAESDSS